MTMLATPPGSADRLLARARLETNLAETIAAYDHAATEYAVRYADADLKSQRLSFQSALRKDLPILDAGCGAGRDCSLFERDGFSPVGLDLSRGLLRSARLVTRAPLVLGDIRCLPFGDHSFGGVWCCAVLLHLGMADALRALKEMHRVLVRSGRLFVTVRFGQGDEWREEVTSSRRWFHLYSVNEIAGLTEEAGFARLCTTVEPGVATSGLWVNIHALSQ